MRLDAISIKNFRVLRRAEISFPDAVIGIVGPNGAGKSTLVEAIAWALYGNFAARNPKKKSEIRWQLASPGEDCEVTLDFRVNEERYRVVRRLVGKSDKGEVELCRGDGSESVGVNETRAYVGQLLGLDLQGFRTSFLARQQELNALSDLQPAKRQAQLASMLGIDRLDRVLEHIKADNRDYGRDRLEKERLVEGGANLASELEEIEAKLAVLSGQKAQSKIHLETARADLQRASEELKSLLQLRDQWVELQARRDAERRSVETLEDRERAIRRELALLETAEKRLAGLTAAMAPLEAVRREVEALRQAQTRGQWRQRLTEQVLAAEKELGQLRQDLNGFDARLKELDRQRQQIPVDIDALIEQARAGLDAARTDYAGKSAEQKRLTNDIADLERQLNDLARYGPDSVCERCRRPLGDDLPRMRGHLVEEIDQLRISHKEGAAALAESLRQGKELDARVKTLEQQRQTRQQLETSAAALTTQKEAALQRTAAARDRKEQAEWQLAEISAEPFDETRLRDLQARLKELERVRTEHSHTEGQLVRLPLARRELAELVRMLTNSRAALSGFESALGQSTYAPEQYERAARRLEQCQAELDRIREEDALVDREQGLADLERRQKVAQIEALEALRRESKELQVAHAHGEKLAKLMADYKQQLVNSIRPTLAVLSGRLVAEMTAGKYSLVELDDDYNLRIMDNGSYFDIGRFSGGEMDLANLCLRLAISQSLTESAGMTRSFVILDEVFGSQDSERRDLIVQALAGLKNRFPQILLITHVEELKHRVEELIEIRPTGRGYSEVIVAGMVA
jgi:exonuclease SbcC